MQSKCFVLEFGVKYLTLATFISINHFNIHQNLKHCIENSKNNIHFNHCIGTVPVS